jgi:putative hemolysin
MNIEDLNELLHTRIPDEDWETLAGFLFGTLEHVPEAGESLIREGWLFTVTEVEGRRIRRVEVSRDPSVDASSLEIDTR